jgi:hypothetical protein
MGFEPQREECLVDFALDGALVAQKQILGELLGDGRAALHDATGLRVGHQGAEGTVKVDAEMLVEAAVLGRQRRLDQIVGHFVERNRIVVLDAAVADLVAVAVEKGHREIGFLQPVFVRGLAHRRHGERQHEEEAAGAERRHLRQRLHQQPAPPAGDMPAVHERGEALVDFPHPLAEQEHGEVDARIDIEQEPLELRHPVVARIGEHVRQD